MEVPQTQDSDKIIEQIVDVPVPLPISKKAIPVMTVVTHRHFRSLTELQLRQLCCNAKCPPSSIYSNLLRAHRSRTLTGLCVPIVWQRQGSRPAGRLPGGLKARRLSTPTKPFAWKTTQSTLLDKASYFLCACCKLWRSNHLAGSPSICNQTVLSETKSRRAALP